MMEMMMKKKKNEEVKMMKNQKTKSPVTLLSFSAAYNKHIAHIQTNPLRHTHIIKHIIHELIQTNPLRHTHTHLPHISSRSCFLFQ